MRAPQDLQATITAESVKIQDRRLILQAQIRLELPLPEQDADLPSRLEASIERGGRMLKRQLFQQAIECADAELILARRQGKQGRGIICRGTMPYTFKTRSSGDRPEVPKFRGHHTQFSTKPQVNGSLT